MYLEQAIRDAVEKGGYDRERARVSQFDMRNGHEGMATSMLSTDRVLLDPAFWQALGKAREWYKGIAPEHEPLYWKAHWHSLIDHLAEGEDVESFFATL